MHQITIPFSNLCVKQRTILTGSWESTSILPQVAAACYAAFLYRIGWGKIKYLPGLPWPLCTDPLVHIQLSPEFSSLLIYSKCLVGIWLGEEDKYPEDFCQKFLFLLFLTLSCAPKPAQILMIDSKLHVKDIYKNFISWQWINSAAVWKLGHPTRLPAIPISVYLLVHSLELWC